MAYAEIILATAITTLSLIHPIKKLISFTASYLIKLLRYAILKITPAVDYILTKYNLFVIYRFTPSIGDHLCMTAIIKALNEQYNLKFIVITLYPELFEHNPKVEKIIDINSLHPRAANWLKYALESWKINHIEEFTFQHDHLSLEDFMRETKKQLHLAEINSMHFKLPTDLNNIKTDFFFTKEELSKFENFFQLPSHYALIHSEGKKTYTPNKEWKYENFENLIKLLPNISWIQIGLESDKPLQACTDYRGKTSTVRELAYLISKADFVVCLEGLYNHLAAAVNTKSFVIFSGFHPPQIALYKTTTPITCEKNLPCMPCWLMEKCPIPSKPCTSAIAPEKVIHIIKNANP